MGIGVRVVTVKAVKNPVVRRRRQVLYRADGIVVIASDQNPDVRHRTADAADAFRGNPVPVLQIRRLRDFVQKIKHEEL